MTPRVQRWVSMSEANGHRVVKYAFVDHEGRYENFMVPGHGYWLFQRDGHWDYDRCEVVGASDLGRVTVDGAK